MSLHSKSDGPRLSWLTILTTLSEMQSESDSPACAAVRPGPGWAPQGRRRDCHHITSQFPTGPGPGQPPGPGSRTGRRSDSASVAAKAPESRPCQAAAHHEAAPRPPPGTGVCHSLSGPARFQPDTALSKSRSSLLLRPDRGPTSAESVPTVTVQAHPPYFQFLN